MATAATLGCKSTAGINLQCLIPSGKLPDSKEEQLRILENFAMKIADRFLMYNADECQLIEGTSNPDGIFNYAYGFMSMHCKKGLFNLTNFLSQNY